MTDNREIPSPRAFDHPKSWPDREGGWSAERSIMPPDPTAQTEPLTTGQRIVAAHESSLIAEPCELAAAIDGALYEVVQKLTPISIKQGGVRWRCFHCGEGFSDVIKAKDHFGSTLDSIPACQIKAHEGHLVEYIRKLEADLSQYRGEDSDIMRSIRTLEAELFTAKRDAEQLGYDRGVRDAYRDAPVEARGALRWIMLHCESAMPDHVLVAISRLLERDGVVTPEQVKRWRDFLLEQKP